MLDVAVVLVVVTPLILIEYGLVHPVRRAVLLLSVGMVVLPIIAAIVINSSGRGGLLKLKAKPPITELVSLLRSHPTLIFTLPLLLIGLGWGHIVGQPVCRISSGL